MVCRKTTASQGSANMLDHVACEAQVRRAVAQARVLVGVGVGVNADDALGRAREHVRPVALAAGQVDDVQAADARGDPLVDDQMAAEPVVLGRDVGQRALAVERERRHARRLVPLQVELDQAPVHPSTARPPAGCLRALARRHERDAAPARRFALAHGLQAHRLGQRLQHDLHLDLRERGAQAAAHAAAERDPAVGPGRLVEEALGRKASGSG